MILPAGRSGGRPGSILRRALPLALVGAMLPAAGQLQAQDDSCVHAGDGICQAWPFARLERLCVPGTDHGDCRGREVLPDSDSDPVAPERLSGQTPEWLRLARNEIFARHGATFRSDDLAAFFAARAWYQPDPGEVSLSPVELANVGAIQALEAAPLGSFGEAGWPVPSGTWRAMLHVEGAPPVPVFGSPTTLRIGAAGSDDVTFVNLTESFLHVQEGENGIGVAQGALPEFVYPAPQWLSAMAGIATPIASEGDRLTFQVEGRPDWADGGVSVAGEVTVNADGVIVAGRFGWLWQECCGGEATEWVEVEFRLEDVEPEIIDPALFVPDRRVEWVYPG